MRKLLRYGDCFVLLAAIFGCLLRLWFQNSGIDNKGLYQATHPAWLLLCALSVGTVVFLWFLTRTAGDNQFFEDNFRPSLLGTGTYLLMALFLGYVGITGFLDATDLLEKITAVVCMLSAVTLAVAGIERFSGNRPAIFLHLIPCAYFALRLFLLGREWGTEPEVCTFLFGFLSALCMIPALYHLWAFDMNMANRQRSLFWSLTAAYFCLVTTFESTQNWVMHMLFAAFLLSNLCHLKFLAAPEAATAEEETPVVEDIPVEEDAPVIEELSVEEDVPTVDEEPPMEEAQEPVLTAIPFPEVAEDAEEAEEAEQVEAQEVFSPMPPLSPKKSRADLHADIDPDADLDAFLADIKLFLENEDY